MKDSKKYILITAVLLAALVLAVILSAAIGARSIPFGDVLAYLQGQSIPEYEAAIIVTRIPRTVFGLLAGAALGISGTLMQAITRNPIADPSILGINAGAALAVVLGMTVFRLSGNYVNIILAFAGGMGCAAAVYGMASAGYGSASPLRLALAGAASTTALSALTNALILPDAAAMDKFRFWQVGSVGAAGWSQIQAVIPFLLAGFIIALCLASSLNVLALGDEMASGLGSNPQRIRALSALAGVLLAASVTALAGPIAFVGLMVPHIIRLLAGANYHWLIPLSALAGADLLVLCDVLGRMMGGAGEMEVGIVTALIGAPFFIWVVRKVKVQSL